MSRLDMTPIDRNTEDLNVRWCIGRAREDGDAEGAALGEILLTMTMNEREAIGPLARAYAERYRIPERALAGYAGDE